MNQKESHHSYKRVLLWKRIYSSNSCKLDKELLVMVNVSQIILDIQLYVYCILIKWQALLPCCFNYFSLSSFGSSAFLIYADFVFLNAKQWIGDMANRKLSSSPSAKVVLWKIFYWRCLCNFEGSSLCFTIYIYSQCINTWRMGCTWYAHLPLVRSSKFIWMS